MTVTRLIGALALCTLSALSHAATLVSFPFTATTNATGVTFPALNAAFASSLPQITPFIGDDGFGNVLEAYPMATATTVATALSTDSFFTITVNASAGAPMELTQLLFEVGKGGASDPRGYFIRSSLDGYTSDLYAQTLPLGASAAPVATVVNLSSIPSMARVSSVTFRFYVYTPTPTSNSIDFRNVSVVGSLAPAVPVPMNQLTWVLGFVLLGFAVVSLHQRRRD